MNCLLPEHANMRRGYTLLELMLALALLGALMSVAWALMGTYRDAEERGWKLSHRTQVMRTAREWLQSDLQQLASTAASTGSNNPETDFAAAPILSNATLFDANNPRSAASRPPRFSFIGDALGFSATIVPPLDPLPFFEQLMSQSQVVGSSSPSQPSALDDLPTARQRSAPGSQPLDNSLVQSPWPQDRIVVEYQLVPVATPRTQVGKTVAANFGNSPRDSQFALVRRERVDNASPSSLDESPFGQPAAEGNSGNSAADRLLTAQDLYRQTDERQTRNGAILRESKLTGITHVRFKYCDGVAWSDRWDSDSAGALPTAVALGFDFPAASEIQRPATPLRSNPLDELEQESLAGEMSFADSALATQPTAEISSASELGMVAGSLSQVQIVVLVDHRRPLQASNRDANRDTSRGGN